MGSFKIVEEGKQAALRGVPMFRNPYAPSHPADQVSSFIAWFAGWCKGEQEKADAYPTGALYKNSNGEWVFHTSKDLEGNQ